MAWCSLVEVNAMGLDINNQINQLLPYSSYLALALSQQQSYVMLRNRQVRTYI